MKRIAIVSKYQADKMLVESLFKPVNGRTLIAERFDRGNYKADSNFIGRELDVSDEVMAVYAVKRKDVDGSYTALMCLSAHA